MYLFIRINYSWLVGFRIESNCPLVGPGIIGGMPSVVVFLRDPSPYLRKFRRKPLLYCWIKANCPFVGPDPVGGVLSVGVFLRDPSQYLREFRRKPRQTQNG